MFINNNKTTPFILKHCIYTHPTLIPYTMNPSTDNGTPKSPPISTTKNMLLCEIFPPLEIMLFCLGSQSQQSINPLNDHHILKQFFNFSIFSDIKIHQNKGTTSGFNYCKYFLVFVIYFCYLINLYILYIFLFYLFYLFYVCFMSLLIFHFKTR